MSTYAIPAGNMTSGGSKITPLTKEDAFEWAERYLSAEIVEEHFPDMIKTLSCGGIEMNILHFLMVVGIIFFVGYLLDKFSGKVYRHIEARKREETSEKGRKMPS